MQLLWFQWNSPFCVPNTHLHNHKQMSKDPQSASISQTRALSLSVLFHFLSHHVWLRYFAFPQFHLKRSRAEALGPEAHANAWEVDGGWGGKKHWNALTPVHLCAQTFPTKAQLWETITSVMLLWLYCCIIRWCCHHLIAQALRLHYFISNEWVNLRLLKCKTAKQQHF